MSQRNLNTVWADLLIEEAVRLGVNFFVISPGSRSTPLTSAVARNSVAEHVVHFDERGAAFMAVGYARATGRPAALICTSGTAAANYLPAIVEASQDCLPLIVLTADRPPELLDCGANQAITQDGLYHGYMRYEVTIPAPTETISPNWVLSTVDQAIHRSLSPPRGPVHLNCQFRKPLDPVEYSQDDQRYLAPLGRWLKNEAAWTTYVRPEQTLTEEAITTLCALAKQAERPLVVAGRLSPEEGRAVSELAVQIGWPLVADLCSNTTNGMIHADLLDWETDAPDLVFWIGGQVIAPAVERLLATAPVLVQLTDHPLRKDPSHQVALRLQADLVPACERIAGELPTGATAWIEKLSRQDAALEAELQDDELSEIAVVRALSRKIPEDHCLFVSNSLAVRHMERFAHRMTQPVAANRGASGIDGIIATAVGYAKGMRRPVTVLIGDLALLHDCNSLALLKDLEVPMTIVVLNNHGGGIFRMLPIAQHKEVFPLFETPHSYEFSALAQQFGLAYTCGDTLPSLKFTRHQLVEIQTQSASVPQDIQKWKSMAKTVREEVVS